MEESLLPLQLLHVYGLDASITAQLGFGAPNSESLNSQSTACI